MSRQGHGNNTKYSATFVIMQRRSIEDKVSNGYKLTVEEEWNSIPSTSTDIVGH